MDLIQHYGPRKVHLRLQNKNIFFHENETKNRPESEMVSYKTESPYFKSKTRILTPKPLRDRC